MKETIIKVEGMVCNGCENRVQNALKNIEGVENVIADHVSGTVTVTSKEEVAESVMKEKIEDIGFEVKRWIRIVRKKCKILTSVVPHATI